MTVRVKDIRVCVVSDVELHRCLKYTTFSPFISSRHAQNTQGVRHLHPTVFLFCGLPPPQMLGLVEPPSTLCGLARDTLQIWCKE